MFIKLLTTMFFLTCLNSANEISNQEKIDEIEIELPLVKDLLHELYFFHTHELGHYTTGFRYKLCTWFHLPEIVRGFLLNAQPEFLNQRDNLTNWIVELELKQYKLTHLEADQSALDYYEQLLKNRYCDYSSFPAINIELGEGREYEFRREFKRFCTLYGIRCYENVIDVHSEECISRDCKLVSYSFLLSLDEVHRRSKFQGMLPVWYTILKSRVHSLYYKYLKEYPYKVVVKKSTSGRTIIALDEKRKKFNIWLDEHFNNFIRKNAKKYSLENLTIEKLSEALNALDKEELANEK